MKIMKSIFKIILILVIIILILSLCLTGVGFVIYKKTIEPKVLIINKQADDYASKIGSTPFTLTENTIIYDKLGIPIQSININNNINVSFDELPKYLIDGYVAVEDKNFWKHNGLDFKAILSAGISLIRNKGEITRGGSTITQQVLKNNVLHNIDDRYERKILEFFLAPKFEKKTTKENILVSYVNTNYYGNRCYGVASASAYYFNKKVSELTPSECAILIGLSNSPTRYNPRNHFNEMIIKRNRILHTMLDEGVITLDEFNNSLEEKPTFTFTRNSRNIESYPTSFAIHRATLKLMEQDGFEFKYIFRTNTDYQNYSSAFAEKYKTISNDIRQGGYKIYTSLNQNQQKLVQSTLDSYLKRDKTLTKEGKYNFQGSATLIDNSTNMITAIVGGRTEEDEYNRAFLSARQPGSVIKPIIIYAPAFATGLYQPSSVLDDNVPPNSSRVPTDSNYFPANADVKYRGKMSIREAVARSVNTIPYKIGLDLGSQSYHKYIPLLKMEHITNGDYYNNALSIGGFTLGTNTSEISSYYNMIVNKGRLFDENFITKITNQSGDEIYSNPNSSTEVFTEDISYLTIDTLREPVFNKVGTARGYKIPDQFQIAKTGTTNNDKDSWLAGATPYYTLSVWVGYDYPKTIRNASSYSGNIYKSIMTELHKNNKPIDFTKPSTVEEHFIDSKGNLSYKDTDKKDLFSGTIIQELDEKQKEIKINAQKSKWNEWKKEFEEFKTILSNQVTSYQSYKIFIDKYNSLYNIAVKNGEKNFNLIENEIHEEKFYYLVELGDIKEKIQGESQSIIEEYNTQMAIEQENTDLINLSNYLSSYESFKSNKKSIDKLIRKYISNSRFYDLVIVYNSFKEMKEQEDIILKEQEEQAKREHEEQLKKEQEQDLEGKENAESWLNLPSS